MNRVTVEQKRTNPNFIPFFLVGSGAVGVRGQKELLLLGSGAEQEDVVIPEFKPRTDGHFFDVRRNSTAEVAKVYAEEADTRDDRNRVTSSDLGVTKNRQPQIDYSEYNIHSQAEAVATLRSFKLAEKYNVIVWLSAEDGYNEQTPEQRKKTGAVYGDGRFNIMLRNMVGDEIQLQGKHIPLSINRFETLALGKKFVEKWGGKTLGKIETVEDLRVQPIGFELKNGESWIDKFREMAPEFGDFWDYIEKGEDVKAEERLKVAVEKAKVVARGDNVMFQMEMLRMGYGINAVGGHGTDWLSGQNNQQGLGILNFTIQKLGGEYVSELKRDAEGRLFCPVCGERVADGVAICPKCRVKFK